MLEYLIPMSPALVPLAFLLWLLLRRVDCPDCGSTLPPFISPFRKTRRMWRVGGYLCGRCGCETDMAGRKVAASTPLTPVPTSQWALLSASLLVAFGLGSAGWFITASKVPPAVVVHPQAPLVAPGN